MSFLISVDPSIPPCFWRNSGGDARFYVLPGTLHLASKTSPLPFPTSLLPHVDHSHLPDPSFFGGGGGFLASMGPFQHKLFCDYILLSAWRALSKTGGLVTHEGRLPTPSLARCPLMSRAATAEGPHSTWHLGNTSLSVRHPAGEWTAP